MGVFVLGGLMLHPTNVPYVHTRFGHMAVYMAKEF